MMQTQEKGVGEQVQEGFKGLREELTAQREHVSDTQEKNLGPRTIFGRKHRPFGGQVE